MKTIKQLVSEWNRWLEDLFDRVYDWVAFHLHTDRNSYNEFVLEDKLNRVRTDNKFLQMQLTKTRADLYELQRLPQSLRDEIYQVLCAPVEQLREASKFSVRKPESGTDWETVTGFCCLGGCDMDVYSFQSERDALLFSMLLKTVGYQPPHNIACANCYSEFLNDCLD